MTYSYYKRGGAMRAFALILASALIIALVWFVSYKNGCVTCSKTDSGRPTVSCQGCPDPKTLTDIDPKPSPTDPNQPIPNNPNPVSPTEPDKPQNSTIGIDIVVDGTPSHFDIDVNNIGEAAYRATSEDGKVTAIITKGDNSGIKVTVNTTKEEEKPVPEKSVTSKSDADAGFDDIKENQGSDNRLTTIQDNTDITSADDKDNTASRQANTPADTQQQTLAPINTMLPAVSLLKGDTFGMEGKVLALGRGCERRDVIVAVIPPEGNCLTLLCDTLCTQKTINAVKAKYPDRIAYTYTIDREYFVNLRGGSYFELYNCAESVDIQSGMEKPAWLTYETNIVPDDIVNSYVAKNELEKFHVKGTNGCLVICEDNDVYRYERF